MNCHSVWPAAAALSRARVVSADRDRVAEGHALARLALEAECDRVAGEQQHLAGHGPQRARPDAGELDAPSAGAGAREQERLDELVAAVSGRAALGASASHAAAVTVDQDLAPALRDVELAAPAQANGTEALGRLADLAL